jgi:hypothetical protein
MVPPLSGFLALAFWWAAAQSSPALPPAVPVILEDFGSLPVGAAPSEGWETRKGEAAGSYSVEAEPSGNRFLHAQDEKRSIQFFRKGGWKLKTHPVLSWRWRVQEFPAGSDERNRAKNDSAAAVYVVFPKRFFIPETIKYVWSEAVPKETVIKHRPQFPILVVRTGREGAETWQTESRNVLEDFRSLFGRRPSDPVALGFLTDANAVKGRASADYDDLRALPLTEPAGP